MFDAEQAKRDYIKHLENEWRRNWCNHHYKDFGCARPRDVPPDKIPTPPNLVPKEWMVHRWATGGIVADYRQFCKLPKSRQNKILKLT